MCFFVGNDFLPHLPSLDIREGALDLLIETYKQVLPALGGYLTHEGEVDLVLADVLLSRIGLVEDEIFRRRRENDERMARRRAQQQQYQDSGNNTGGAGAGAGTGAGAGQPPHTRNGRFIMPSAGTGSGAATGGHGGSTGGPGSTAKSGGLLGMPPGVTSAAAPGLVRNYSAQSSASTSSVGGSSAGGGDTPGALHGGASAGADADGHRDAAMAIVDRIKSSGGGAMNIAARSHAADLSGSG